MTTRERCEPCGGFTSQRGYLHYGDCPNSPPKPQPPAPRQPDALDRLAELRRAYRRLNIDLRAANGDLDAPSRTDWPPSCEAIPALMSIGQQFEIVDILAASLDQYGCFAARGLVSRVRKLLDAHPPAPGFRAPQTSTPPIQPPRAVALALERLRQVTPHAAALATPQPDDSESIARDRRLVAWWVATIDSR